MTGASRDLVVGVDAGGTGTRAVAATVEGAVVGRGSGGPGNPTAHGIPVAVGSLVAAVRSALRGQDGTRVVRVLIAGAGGGAVIAPDLPAALAAALAAEGLAAPVDYRPDVEAAYAAGTADPDGYVLVAGTGAAACEIAAGAMVRYVDGNGWLVGDDGSGFWLGREAVRAALAALDGRGGPTRLVERVAAYLGVEPDRDALVAGVYAGAPVRLAALAPLVTAAHADGDAVATRIVRDAVRLLLGSLAGLRPVAERRLVLTGGVAGGVVGRLVADAAAARWSVLPGLATEPATGAAWLALRAAGLAPPARVHARLTGATAGG